MGAACIPSGLLFPLVGHSHGSIDSFLTKLNFSQFLNALNMWLCLNCPAVLSCLRIFFKIGDWIKRAILPHFRPVGATLFKFSEIFGWRHACCSSTFYCHLLSIALEKWPHLRRFLHWAMGSPWQHTGLWEGAVTHWRRISATEKYPQDWVLSGWIRNLLSLEAICDGRDVEPGHLVSLSVSVFSDCQACASGDSTRVQSNTVGTAYAFRSAIGAFFGCAESVRAAWIWLALVRDGGNQWLGLRRCSHPWNIGRFDKTWFGSAFVGYAGQLPGHSGRRDASSCPRRWYSESTAGHVGHCQWCCWRATTSWEKESCHSRGLDHCQGWVFALFRWRLDGLGWWKSQRIRQMASPTRIHSGAFQGWPETQDYRHLWFLDMGRWVAAGQAACTSPSEAP